MSRKEVFHKFSNSIYPTDIVVVITNNETAIKNRFLDRDGDEIELPIQCDALVANVTERDTRERCELIVFRKKEYMTIATIAHEAFHAMQNIAEKVGLQCYDDSCNEHMAYLIGWIADCCDQVRTNKFKK